MKKVVLLFLFISICFFVNATTYFWVGSSGTWGTAACFATTSGGSGSVLSPTSADIVIFDQNSGNPTVTITALTINVSQLQLNTTGASVIVTLSGTATSFAISGTTNCLTLSSNCTLNDGGNKLNLSGNISGSGTHAGLGRLVMANAKTIASGLTLGNVSLQANTFNGNVTITGDVLHNGTNTTNGNTVTVGGNLITYNTTSTINTSTGKLVMTGSMSTQSVGNIILSANTGTSYAAGDIINFSSPPAGGITAIGIVTTVTSGAISGVGILDPGSGYISAPTVTSITTTAGTGATLANITAVLSTSTTKYIGGRTTTNIENLELNNSNNIIAIGTSRQFTITGSLTFNASNTAGLLTINNGSTLAIGSGGSATVSMASTNAIGTAIASSGNLIINSVASNIGTLYFDQTSPATTNRVSQFTLTAGNLTFGNSLQTNSNVTLTAGTLTLGANASFLVNGSTFTRGTGVINASNSNSTFKLTSSAAITVPSGLFSPATVTNFVDSSTSSSPNAHTLGSAITVTNFKLANSSSGAFTCTNGSNLTIANGGSITMQRTNSVGTLTFGTAPTFAGIVDIIYLGSQVMTTGVEMPTSTSVINNLTINTSAGTTGITLGAAATVNGTLFLSSGVFTNTSTLSMANGSTIVRGQAGIATSGSLSTTPTFGTGVNITILGTAAITSANELPTGGSYGTITVNNTTSYSLVAGISITANSIVVGSGGVAGVFQNANTTSIITITVTNGITVGDGATFQCGTQSATVTHVLNVGGNISIGNGSTFNMTSSSTPSSRYMALVFNSSSATNQTISATGTPTLVTFGTIILNRGNPTYKVVCSVTANTTPSGQVITYTNGTWEQAAGTLTFSTGSTQTIPSTGVLILSGSGGMTLNGSLSIAASSTLTVNTSGVLNVGSGASNLTVSGASASASFTAGTINVNGRFELSSSASVTINGATINIPTGGTVSNASASIFWVTSTSSLNFTSGAINVKSNNAVASASFPDIFINSSAALTGGTITVSDVTALVRITPAIYNFTVINGAGTAVARLTGSSLSVTNNLILTSGTFDAATNNINVTVGGILTLTAGTFSMASSTLTLNGPSISVAAATLNTTSSTNLIFGGTDAGPLSIPSTVIALNNLTLNNTNVTPATLNVTAASIALNGALAITSGTINMGANVLSSLVGATSGGGTLKTQNTSSTPLPSGKTWAFTVEYNNANGAQTIMGGSYTTGLTISNSNATTSTGMNVLSSLLSTTVNGLLTLSTGANLALNGATLTLGSTSTIAGSGTLSGAGAASSVAGAVNNGTLSITGSTQNIGTINFSTASTQASTLSNMNMTRLSAIVTIGTCSSNILTITGTLALNSGTLDDGGNTITIGGGNFVSTTNTVNGAAVHTGTGSLKYTRSNGNLTSGAGTFLSLGNINVAGTGTQTINTTSSSITINGTLSFGTTNNIGLNSQTLIVATNGVINAGTNQLTGAGTVTINGVFKTANTSGLIGSIPTATISTLGSSSTIEYTSNSSHAITTRTDYNNLTLSGGSSKSLSGDIAVGGALTLSASSDKLSIGSNTLSLNGSVNASGSGFITGSSTSNISIGGTGSFGSLMMDQSSADVSNMVQNLTIDRTTQTATLGNALRLAGVLTPTAGTIASAGNLTLASTSSNTARIAEGSSSGGYITGNVTVERYISSSANRAYRLLTPSVNTSTTINANWQEGQSNASTSVNQPSSKAGYGTHITGTGGSSNGFDATVTNQASLYIYNPLGSWDAVTNTNVNTLNANTGYLLFVRGNRDNINVLQSSTPSSNTTLRATGTLPQGSIGFTGLSSNTDFSLVTNPYASPILWDNATGIYTAGSNATNFENYITIWDPNIGTRGGFVTVTTGNITAGGATSLTNEIQSGQAFFVQTKPGITSPTLSLLEAHKSTNNNLDVFRTGTQTEMLKTFLFYNDNSGVEHSADGVTSIFNNNYANNVDGEDALQIDNWDEDVAISRNGKLLSIEAKKLADANDTINLAIARLKTQQYRWKLVPQNFNAPGLTAVLRDNFTNTNNPFSLSDTTIISFVATADPASKAADRFSIIFKQSIALPVSIISIKAYQKNQGIALDWVAQQEINIKNYEVEKSLDGISFKTIGVLQSKGNAATSSYNWLDPNIVNGYNFYRIKAIEKSGKENFSQVVKVAIGKAAASISIYPNPIVNNTINLKLDNIPQGNYTIIVTNQTGQQILTKAVSHNGGSAIDAIILDAQLTAGNYYLKLLGQGGLNWRLQFVKP